jgi:hypothetical protein
LPVASSRLKDKVYSPLAPQLFVELWAFDPELLRENGVGSTLNSSPFIDSEGSSGVAAFFDTALSCFTYAMPTSAPKTTPPIAPISDPIPSPNVDPADCATGMPQTAPHMHHINANVPIFTPGDAFALCLFFKSMIPPARLSPNTITAPAADIAPNEIPMCTKYEYIVG